ncbi:hypothetical protein ZWY2020_028469 [Hordeum vulgare]|nr:hypothetical protein ZWY2020_028469 [Hordeum vulgare]
MGGLRLQHDRAKGLLEAIELDEAVVANSRAERGWSPADQRQQGQAAKFEVNGRTEPRGRLAGVGQRRGAALARCSFCSETKYGEGEPGRLPLDRTLQEIGSGSRGTWQGVSDLALAACRLDGRRESRGGLRERAAHGQARDLLLERLHRPGRWLGPA